MPIRMAVKTLVIPAAAAACLLSLFGCSSLSPRPPCGAAAGADPAVICTAEGPVRGVVVDGQLAVKGIPFAAPPLGARRWQAPAAVTPWTEPRDGTRFGAVCPQLSGSEVVGDEDCLTVNVWAPRPAPARALPVMVFFTGGGNHAFSGQGAGGFGGVQYNGDQLVPQGAVVVTFNYRLGALGFLALDGGAGGNAGNLGGNYGSLDQVAMLHWVHRNIAAFGGDPQRVFLFGTSAGGGNLCALLTAPATRGLFHGVALQSSVPTGCELPTLADAQRGSGARVAAALGCTDAACLRAKPMADVVRAVPGTFGVLPRLYGPNVDGELFPDQPIAIISRGAHAAVPVIVGNTARETAQFVNAVGPVTDAASYEAGVRKVFGDATERIVATYPATAYPTPRDALVRLTTDALFTCSSRRVARTLAAHQAAPVYRYVFDHALENDAEQRALGAVHTVEHPFFFGWKGSYRPTEADLGVQRLLTGHWTAVARDGRTEGWPVAVPDDRYLRVSATPAIAWDDAARCDFWDTVKLPWPHL